METPPKEKEIDYEKGEPLRTIAIQNKTKDGDAAITVYELWSNGRITFCVSLGRGLLAFFRADFLQSRPNLVEEDENAFRKLICEKAGSGNTKEIPIPQWYADSSRKKEYADAVKLKTLIDRAISNPQKLSEGRMRDKGTRMKEEAREELQRMGLLKDDNDIGKVVEKIRKDINAS